MDPTASHSPIGEWQVKQVEHKPNRVREYVFTLDNGYGTWEARLTDAFLDLFYSMVSVLSFFISALHSREVGSSPLAPQLVARHGKDNVPSFPSKPLLNLLGDSAHTERAQQLIPFVNVHHHHHVPLLLDKEVSKELTPKTR
jgi:hypothetical protein